MSCERYEVATALSLGILSPRSVGKTGSVVPIGDGSHDTRFRPGQKAHNIAVIRALRENLPGGTWSEYARIMGMKSRRTMTSYQKLLAGIDEGQVRKGKLQGGPPVDVRTISPGDPRFACVQDNPDGFKAFFNTYARYPQMERFPGLQTHSERIVRATWNERKGAWEEGVIVNVPVRHGKSEVLAIWFSIWRLVLDRAFTIIILSKSSTLAEAFTVFISTQLESHPELIADFGRFKPDEGEGEWQPRSGALDVAGRAASKDRSIRARGSGQQIPGMGADLLLADDVVLRENSLTKERRDSLEEWFRLEALSRVEDEGRVVVIGSRVHKDDLYSRLLQDTLEEDDEDQEESRPWKHVVFPALADPETGEPSLGPNAVALWPQKWPRSKLLRRKARLKGTFNASHQQNPIDPEDALYQREWFYGGTYKGDVYQGCLDEDRGLLESPWPRDKVIRVIAIDPSPTKYAAAVLLDLIPFDPSFPTRPFSAAVLDIKRSRMGQREMLEVAMDWHERAKPIDYLLFEHNNFAKWWLERDDLQKFVSENSIWIRGQGTYANKNDRENGFDALALDVQFARVRFPYKGEARAVTERFITEATEWTSPKDTDDQIMALWFPRAQWKTLRTPSTAFDQIVNGGWEIPEFVYQGMPA
jgi:hypothetical protein